MLPSPPLTVQLTSAEGCRAVALAKADAPIAAMRRIAAAERYLTRRILTLLRLGNRLAVQVEELDVGEPAELLLDLGVIADDHHHGILRPEQHLRAGPDRLT